MAKQTINLGTMADNKSGDPLRTAFTKINENFDELYAQTNGGVGVNVGDQTTEPSQVTDVVFSGATVENVNGVSTVTITPTTIPPIPSLGDVTVTGSTITGGRAGAAGTIISIGTNYLGDTPGVNSTAVQVDPTIPGLDQVTAGWVIRMATGEVRTLVAAYHWTQTDDFWVLQWDQTYLSQDPVFPLTVESPDYQVGDPTQLVLSSGTTSPGSAVAIKETEVDISFSGIGVTHRITPTGIQLTAGAAFGHQPAQTFTAGGMVIQPSDLAGATVGWGAPTINADNIVTNGWDYVSFSNQTWYDYLWNLLGGQQGGVAVTWSNGSTEINSNVFVQFTDVNTFQFVPSNDGGGSNIPGTWYFPLNIGATVFNVPAATTVNAGDSVWILGENGDTILPGALIESVAQIPQGDRIVDITKSVVVLNDGGTWTLPDGMDGQRISFVPDNASYKQNIWLSGKIASWQWNDPQQNITLAGVGNGWWINPFMNWGEDLTNSQFQSRTLVDAVWVNGAWHFQGGVFD